MVIRMPGLDRLFWGVILLAVGLFIGAIAVGAIRVDPASVHVPRWVVFTIGLVFVLAGMSSCVGRSSRAADRFAAIILLAMSAVGGWISLFGASSHFSGGLPFVPRGADVAVARALMGCGSLVAMALSTYALRRAFRRDV